MTNISKERRDWASVSGAPDIRRRGEWGAVHNYSTDRNVVEPATRVFVHISVTNPGSYRGNDAHAQAIERIGRARFGTGAYNTGISYNFGVMHDASLYEFQPVSRRGAHTVNDYRISRCTRSGSQCPGRNQPLTAPSWNLNYNARAFVICQNVDDSVTDQMVDTLAQAIVTSYRAGFVTRHAAEHPHGHRCVSGKSCPGNRMWARMDDLKAKIRQYINNGLPIGGTVMSWGEDLSPGTPGDDITNLANSILPDNWGRSAADLLGYSAAGAHIVIDGQKLARRIWRQDHVIPSPKNYSGRDGNPHWHGSRYLQEIWDMLFMLRDVPDRLEALEARVGGASDNEIKQLINRRHDEAAEERERIATELEGKIDGVQDILQQHADGNLDAQQVVEALRAMMHAATAPASSDNE